MTLETPEACARGCGLQTAVFPHGRKACALERSYDAQLRCAVAMPSYDTLLDIASGLLTVIMCSSIWSLSSASTSARPDRP